MKGNQILIDTSVWMAYLKENTQAFSEKVDRILTEAEIFVPRVVMAELIQGAKSEKEISVIGEFINAFRIIDQTQNTWMEAGRLSSSMKKKGITIHLMNCYIAVQAIENHCRVFSLDEHFKLIKNFTKLKLVH